MTLPNQVTPPAGGWGELFQRMTGWPSPEKLYAEFQRLNNNMEKMQPDLHKVAQAVDGLYLQDIRNLTQVLQGMRVGEMLKTVGDAKDTIEKLINKLWGR